ncbi:MAG: T9SS type A sorting domain-containing protein [Bacteroidales bacterium]|nr:T9SS type A sorting domain-containing protein [Bacteroidales bacterium]
MKNLLSILLAIFIGQIVQAGTVSGTCLYHGDSTRPINQAIVTLKNLESNQISTFITGPDGNYLFTSVQAGSYQIIGTKNSPGMGVNMVDATLVLFHILGFYPFDDIQTLAADVTGNGTISLADYNLIVRHIVRGTAFPIGEWVFLNEIIEVTDLKDSRPGGLTGSSSGDVGGVFVPGTRDLEAYPMAMSESLKVTANEPFTVSIRTNDALTLSGAGLFVNYPSEIVTIESIEFPVEGYEYEIDGNRISLVWNDLNGGTLQLEEGSSLITFHCRTNASFAEGMSAKFTLNGNSSLVSNTYTEIKDAKLQAPVIEYSMPALKLSNYPNPFTTSTTLAYYLPNSGDVNIAIFDYNGRQIREYKIGEVAQGYHSLTIEGSGLTPGSYFCKLSLSGSNTQTIRLLKTN